MFRINVQLQICQLRIRRRRLLLCQQSIPGSCSPQTDRILNRQMHHSKPAVRCIRRLVHRLSLSPSQLDHLCPEFDAPNLQTRKPHYLAGKRLAETPTL